MVPCFFMSCQSSTETRDEVPSPALMTSAEYVYIPIKFVQISYHEERNWRIITQYVEYVDNSTKNSVSSIWINQAFPLEIIVLDNPDLHDSLVNNLNEFTQIALRRMKVFLPFNELIAGEDLDSQLPVCFGNEFRAVARIVSSQMFIGIPSEYEFLKLNNASSFRSWYQLGEIICVNLVRHANG